MLANRDPADLEGVAVHLYRADRSMVDRVFANADGELLIIPQAGALRIVTELGRIDVAPGWIALIPRGVRFRVEVEGEARGYVAENHGAMFRLPELGPIGSNGLANARDFETPVAAYEDVERPCELVQKYLGSLWTTTLDHSPLDVVAWHGNLAPWRYELARFNTIGSISFDHPDPSIFTVLTSPSDVPGRANADFVIFPPRWMVAEGTFRPPWFHRNVMSEAMGLIHGAYDAKADGFAPGGLQPAQSDERARPRRRQLESRERGRAEAGQDRRDDGVHGRKLLAVTSRRASRSTARNPIMTRPGPIFRKRNCRDAHDRRNPRSARARAGWRAPTATPTSRSRICRSGCFRVGGGEPRIGAAIGDDDRRLARAGRGGAARRPLARRR